MRHRVMTIAVVSTVATIATAQGPTVATYEAKFEATWTEATHPQDFPENPHFSPLIGGTHNASVHLWGPGEIASNAIELIAEQGRFGEMLTDIENRIAMGDAESVIRQSGTPSPGERVRVFTTHQSHPLVTWVTMLAPSPDWFVGVYDVPLFVDGAWVDELVFELDPWDSGTDAGLTYTSPNDDITPHIPIANLSVEFPFLNGTPVARMTFTLMFTAAGGCSRADLAPPHGSMDFSDVVEFLSAFAAGHDNADIAPPFDTWDFTDVTAFIVLFADGCG